MQRTSHKLFGDRFPPDEAERSKKNNFAMLARHDYLVLHAADSAETLKQAIGIVWLSTMLHAILGVLPM